MTHWRAIKPLALFKSKVLRQDQRVGPQHETMAIEAQAAQGEKVEAPISNSGAEFPSEVTRSISPSASPDTAQPMHTVTDSEARAEAKDNEKGSAEVVSLIPMPRDPRTIVSDSPAPRPEVLLGELAMRRAEMAEQAGPGTKIDAELENLSKKTYNIICSFEKVNLDIHKSMSPHLFKELGFDKIVSTLNSIFTQMVEQNTESIVPHKLTVPMPDPDIFVVDSETDVANMMADIIGQTSTELSQGRNLMLGLDLEAVNLSRDGDISIISVYLPPTNTVYLVDVCELKDGAFCTPASPSTPKMTLKYVLESQTVTKLLFDCRGDNCALHGLYDIHLAGVIDLQLMELAVRKDRVSSIKALKQTVESRAQLNGPDKKAWEYAKLSGACAFKYGPEEAERRISLSQGDLKVAEATPEKVEAILKGQKPTEEVKASAQHNQEWQHADRRPLHELMKKYCAYDVILLPQLYQHFIEHDLWREEWAKRVAEETGKRLEVSRREDSQAGKGGKEAPEGWVEFKKAEQQAEKQLGK